MTTNANLAQKDDFYRKGKTMKTIPQKILDMLPNMKWADAKNKIELEGFKAEELDENMMTTMELKPDVIMVWLDKAKNVISVQAGNPEQVI